MAHRISRFEEVEACHLMSGGYDLMVIVQGKNLHAVATFVSERLATIEGVLSTATHFFLRSYKEHGHHYSKEGERIRRNLLLARKKDESKDYIADHVQNLPRSGIRDFFAIVSEMPQAISLGIGEPDFVTPWKIREASIFALERGKDIIHRQSWPSFPKEGNFQLCLLFLWS